VSGGFTYSGDKTETLQHQAQVPKSIQNKNTEKRYGKLSVKMCVKPKYG